MSSENSKSISASVNSIKTNNENTIESETKRSSTVKKSKLIKLGKKFILPIFNNNNPALKKYIKIKESMVLFIFLLQNTKKFKNQK